MLWVISRPQVSPRMMRVRFTRCVAFRRPLMGLINKCWPKSMWCRSRQVPDAHAHELIAAGALLCLAVMDLRTPVSGLVTCSDASTSGGGMCASNGLTAEGLELLAQLDAAPYESECFMPQGSVQCFNTKGPLRRCQCRDVCLDPPSLRRTGIRYGPWREETRSDISFPAAGFLSYRVGQTS